MFDPYIDDLNEEEMEWMLLEAIEWITTDFQLRWEPHSGDLQGLLEAYTKDQLLELCEKNAVHAKKSWRKGEIIFVLADRILNTLEERILLLETDQLNLLINYVTKNEEITSLKDRVAFYLNVFSQMTQLGLFFNRVEQGDLITHVPFELVHFLSSLEERKNSPEIQEKLVFSKQLKEVVTASVHLYGVITDSRVLALWSIKYPQEGVTFDFYEDFYSILPILNIQKNYFTMNSIIASPEFDSELQAMSFYLQTHDKMGNDYYQPTASELAYYAKHSFDRQTAAYKKLYRIAQQIANHPEIVMDILERHLVRGNPLSKAMEELEIYEEVIFDGPKHFEKFAQAYIHLNNQTRLWENAGYTPTELNQELSADQQEIVQVFSENIPKQPMIRVEKIGRNDPCPCGSGKKYKKCCMNK